VSDHQSFDPRPVPDEERREPRVADDQDPGQGPPVDDAEDDEIGDPEAPALGVIDPTRADPPEPNEPA
jgi:hypothetical protein